MNRSEMNYGEDVYVWQERRKECEKKTVYVVISIYVSVAVVYATTLHISHARSIFHHIIPRFKYHEDFLFNMSPVSSFIICV